MAVYPRHVAMTESKTAEPAVSGPVADQSSSSRSQGVARPSSPRGSDRCSWRADPRARPRPDARLQPAAPKCWRFASPGSSDVFQDCPRRRAASCVHSRWRDPKWTAISSSARSLRDGRTRPGEAVRRAVSASVAPRDRSVSDGSSRTRDCPAKRSTINSTRPPRTRAVGRSFTTAMTPLGFEPRTNRL